MYKKMQKFIYAVAIIIVAWSDLCLADGYTNVKAEKLIVSSLAYNGQALSYLKTDHPEVTALIVTIPPGGSTGWHEHPVPVYAYMLDGELTVELKNGASRRFMKGEPILEVTNRLHNGVNTGKQDARLVVFYTGAAGVPNVVREKATVSGIGESSN
jgi:quercetin dioxygenase-like cupin family protein